MQLSVLFDNLYQVFEVDVGLLHQKLIWANHCDAGVLKSAWLCSARLSGIEHWSCHYDFLTNINNLYLSASPDIYGIGVS